ncbi:glycosyltransferase family 2 protein [Frigoribacterium sp. PhB118]|uniref:glycosyltransferase family 2 protein n=1 Tax=Frigoribacterium sp. PhB118 TaxID=2485175 RepID=UPI000FAAE49B|nr:glycosyltransferase [Frigoribacterium sp. PhB118]ROS57571.1 GT2 family glycosyltransferase [Frigoribacterium sp. PhB118]
MSRDAGSPVSDATDTAPPAGGRFVVGNAWDALDGVWPDLPPLVSVVVVHYRQQAELDRTLAALARQSYPAERLEVIVVDDGSPTPPTVPEGVRLIVQEDLGFRLSAARNVGVAASSGSVLCFVDADTSPEPDYVLRLTRLPALAPEAVTVGQRKHADFAGVLGGDGGAGDGVAGVGGDGVAVPVSEPVEVAGPAHELEQPRWLQQAYGWSADLLHADDRSYRHLIGAVTCCTRWFFDQVGGFDESFTSYGGEDWEWAHRAWLAGGVFAHVPGAVAWHDGPDWAGRATGAGAGSAASAGSVASAASAGSAVAREDEEARRQAEKNGETLRLADLIAVRGSRGFGVRSRAVDVCVDLVASVRTSISAGAAFVAVDSVLAAMPDATVVVPDDVAPVFEADQRVRGRSSDAAAAALGGARVVVTLDGPVRVLPAVEAGGSDDARVQALAAAVGLGDDVARDLRTATDAVGVGSLGTLELADPSGRVLVTVESRRAVLRARRWGAGVAFVSHRASVDWLTPVTGEPSVAAYLGGWG